LKRLGLLFVIVLLASCKRKKPESFTEIFLADDHACGKVTSGAIVCWGGKYGDVPSVVPDMTSLPKQPATTEAAPPSLTDVVQVAKGRAHACALRRDATVWCWGDNSFYQLADGTKESRDRPAMIQGVFGVQQIVAAGDGTCARLGDGDMRCWGNNTNGQLSPQMHPRVAINVPTSVRH
jgi:alpha-tubulin suppressor-like RCC1 family protein